MSDVKYDTEKLEKDAQDFIDKFRTKFKAIADECLGDLYCNIGPYIETDQWTNYREALRIELEHEYKYSRFKDEWATNFRRAVFVENREEISKLISDDILKRIKYLEDCHQDYKQFRYTPRGDCYQNILSQLKLEREKVRGLVADMQMLANGPGPHVAEPHEVWFIFHATEALTRYGSET
jgi:hypothetical protein